MTSFFRKLLIATLCCSIVVLSGCTSRITDFTIISTKNIDLSKVSSYTKGSNRVSGEDKMHIILFIPTALNISVKQAIDNAIQSVPGCVALVDGVVSQSAFYFLYGYQSYIVEGTPLLDKKMGDLESNYKSGKLTMILDEFGKVVQTSK